MRGYRYYTRRFLNQRGHGSSAHIIASVSRGGGRGAGYGSLEIMDCNRKAALEFSLDPDDRENSLYKAHQLERIVRDFVFALEEEVGLAERTEAE